MVRLFGEMTNSSALSEQKPPLDQLALYQSGEQIIPTTLLRAHKDFKPSYGSDFHNGQLDEAERLSVHGMAEK